MYLIIIGGYTNMQKEVLIFNTPFEHFIFSHCESIHPVFVEHKIYLPQLKNLSGVVVAFL